MARLRLRPTRASRAAAATSPSSARGATSGTDPTRPGRRPGYRLARRRLRLTATPCRAPLPTAEGLRSNEDDRSRARSRRPGPNRCVPRTPSPRSGAGPDPGRSTRRPAQPAARALHEFRGGEGADGRRPEGLSDADGRAPPPARASDAEPCGSSVRPGRSRSIISSHADPRRGGRRLLRQRTRPRVMDHSLTTAFSLPRSVSGISSTSSTTTSNSAPSLSRYACSMRAASASVKPGAGTTLSEHDPGSVCLY